VKVTLLLQSELDALGLTIRARGEHYLVGGGIKRGEKLFDQPRFHATSFPLELFTNFWLV